MTYRGGASPRGSRDRGCPAYSGESPKYPLEEKGDLMDCGARCPAYGDRALPEGVLGTFRSSSCSRGDNVR